MGLEFGRAPLGSPHVESLIALLSDVSSGCSHLWAPGGTDVQDDSLTWGVI